MNYEMNKARKKIDGRNTEKRKDNELTEKYSY